MTNPPPNYDGIARAYRWLEYLTLGPLLQRTRTAHLSRLGSSHQALIFGDGDGRFTTQLLATNPTLRVDAVDISPVMLYLLKQRCQPFGDRLHAHQTDVRTFAPQTKPDLVVTHFFLDCLTQTEVDSLITQLTPRLTANALWLVSDFSVPSGFLRHPARIYIRLLYFAFKILTGMIPTQLPNHTLPLQRAGFFLIAEQHYLFGVLITQLWQRQ